MFGLSGVWKGDRRCRAVRGKSQAAKTKVWILTTTKLSNLLLLGSLQEAGRMLWALISQSSSDGSRVRATNLLELYLPHPPSSSMGCMPVPVCREGSGDLVLHWSA